MKDYRTTTECARLWSVDRSTVVEWCKQGLIPGAYQVGKRWRIPSDAKPPIIRRSPVTNDKAKALALSS